MTSSWPRRQCLLFVKEEPWLPHVPPLAVAGRKQGRLAQAVHVGSSLSPPATAYLNPLPPPRGDWAQSTGALLSPVLSSSSWATPLRTCPAPPNSQTANLPNTKAVNLRVSHHFLFCLSPIPTRILIQLILPKRLLSLSVSNSPGPGHPPPFPVSLIFLPLIFRFPIFSLDGDSL